MRGTIFLCLLLAVFAAACYNADTAPPVEAEPPEEAATAEALEASYPDPGAEEAAEVEGFVRSWVGGLTDDRGVYAIPPRGGHEVSGTLGAFHTVHQEDADSYSVCVDFQDQETVYDVDFFVDRTPDGLVMANHYLHKIDGAVVE